MSIHINVPHYDSVLITRVKCPTCDKVRAILTMSQEWYGCRSICLRCGEQWGDGERLPRPFARGWRKQSVEEARKIWIRYKRANGSSSRAPQEPSCAAT